MIFKISFIILFLSFTAITPLMAEEPLKIAYSANGKPWAWKDADKNRGILIEIANEALSKRMGVKITHHFYPWKRAQIYVERGKVDALITNHTKKRKEYTLAGNELVTNIKRSIFMKKGNPKIADVAKITGLNQLDGFKVGNYAGNGWAEKNLKHLKVIWAVSSDNALAMLVHNRFDIFIGNPVSTKYALRNLNIDNIVMLPNSLKDIKPSQFKLLIRKESEYVNILNDFDKTLQKMKKEGVLDSIFNKYQ